jgi:hypothetical protein
MNTVEILKRIKILADKIIESNISSQEMTEYSDLIKVAGTKEFLQKAFNNGSLIRSITPIKLDSSAELIRVAKDRVLDRLSLTHDTEGDDNEQY